MNAARGGARRSNAIAACGFMQRCSHQPRRAFGSLPRILNVLGVRNELWRFEMDDCNSAQTRGMAALMAVRFVAFV